MSSVSGPSTLSNRDSQKYILLGVFVVTIGYLAVTQWIPDAVHFWTDYRNKKQILRRVQTESVKNAADQIQKIESKREKVEIEKPEIEHVSKEPNFLLKRKAPKEVSKSSGSPLHAELLSRPEGVSNAYISPPVVRKTPEQIALERSRKLKAQQDLAYQKSVEEDAKKMKVEQDLERLRNAKNERIEIIRATANKKRAFAEGEKTVRLSFRYGARTKGPSKIKNGDILDSTVTLKNVMGVFSASDTVEYLLDFVEAQEQIMALKPLSSSEKLDNFLELSLSYPMRTINRSSNPMTTLQDLSIENDSVVWITFL